MGYQRLASGTKCAGPLIDFDIFDASATARTITAFIIDVFSRAIVGWKVSTRMNTDMVLDALEQALLDRGMPKNVIHHSDRGVQYLSIRYTNRWWCFKKYAGIKRIHY